MRKIIIMATAIFSLFSTNSINAQMNYWTIFPNKIDMVSSTNLPIASLSNTPISNLYASNAAYDVAGNVLFYVSGTTVYTGSGAVIGQLTNLSYKATASSEWYLFSKTNNEVSIVPVPNDCSKFYVIYTTLGSVTVGGVNQPIGLGALLYSIVDVSNNTIQSCSNAIAVGTNSCALAPYAGINNNPYVIEPMITQGEYGHSGIAVSKLIGGVRYLYVASGNLKRYTISATGIGAGVVIASGLVTPTIANPFGVNDFKTTELELSDDGTALSWGNDGNNSGLAFQAKIFQVRLTSNSATTINFSFVSPIVGSTSLIGFKDIRGCEIDNATKEVYFTSNQGLQKWIPTQVPGLYPTAASTTYTNSQIEKAKNGFYYLYDNNGRIARFAATTGNTAPTISQFTTLPLSANGLCKSTTQLQGIQLLPDQIDGEDYNYFYGVLPSTVDFKINNTVVNASNPMAVFFSCNSIPLNNLSTNATNYKIDILPTNAVGTPLGGAVYSSGWITTFPTNLLALPGTNGTYLASNTGYYKITISTQNRCNNEAVISKVGYAQIVTKPTQVLTINNGSGGICNTGASITTACNVGCYSLSHNVGIAGSGLGTNYFDKYQYTLREVNCTTGVDVAGGYSFTSPLVTISSGVVNAINWNTATAGYFAANCTANLNKCYRLVNTVTNACGSTPATAFVKITGAYKTSNPNLTTSNEFLANVSPNPASSKVEFNIELTEETKTSIEIYDLQGKLVATVLNKQLLNKGINNIHYSLENLSN